MSSLEICQLSDHLDPAEIKALRRVLADADLGQLEESDDPNPVAIAQNYDDDSFDDFWDQVDANDAACDVYLPTEFEENFEIEGRKVGSAHALLLALANLREDMFTEEDEEEEEDDDGDLDDELDEFDDYGDSGDDDFAGDDNPELELKAEQLRLVWKTVHKAARLAISKRLALFVHE